MGYRVRRFLAFPVGQPGDFPRGLGSEAGEPILTKSGANESAMRPGDNLVIGFCQGNGASATILRASHNCQVIVDEGRFYGKPAVVLSIDADGQIEVKSKDWAVSRRYPAHHLRLQPDNELK
jgi:hypothetical protein